MLQISGHKLVDVDKNQQDVTVSGWIRPQDIAVGSNTVESARIADATINYVQKGALGRPRSGILGRVLGSQYRSVQNNLHYVDIAAVVLIAAAIVYLVIRRQRRRLAA